MSFRKKLTYKDFKQYFSNHLLDREKHAFEKKMMQDAFEEEAFDGLSKLNKGELKQDIAELKGDILKKTKAKRTLVPLWLRYAAVVAILIGMGTILFYTTTQFNEKALIKEQIAQEQKTMEPSAPQINKQYVQLPISDANPIHAEGKKSSPVIGIKQKKTEPRNIAQAEDFTSSPNITNESDSKISEKKDETEAIAEIIEESPALKETAVQNVLEGKVAGVNAQSGSKSLLRKNEEVFRKKSMDKSLSEQILARTVKGKVISTEDNSSLPGVTITVEGTSLGTVTNMDGEFSIEIPANEKEQLVANYIGFKPQMLPAEQDTTLLVMLEPELSSLDEVVVVGYGTSNVQPLEPVRTNAKPINPKGVSQYKQYIIENIDYSKLSNFPGSHKIKFSFTVNTDGSLTNFNFTQSPDPTFNDEITRVVKGGNKWAPATEDDEPIISTVTLILKIEIK